MESWKFFCFLSNEAILTQSSNFLNPDNLKRLLNSSFCHDAILNEENYKENRTLVKPATFLLRDRLFILDGLQAACIYRTLR